MDPTGAVVLPAVPTDRGGPADQAAVLGFRPGGHPAGRRVDRPAVGNTIITTTMDRGDRAVDQGAARAAPGEPAPGLTARPERRGPGRRRPLPRVVRRRCRPTTRRR